MHRKEQYELIVVELQQNRQQQRTAREIKRLLTFLKCNPASLRLSLTIRPVT